MFSPSKILPRLLLAIVLVSIGLLYTEKGVVELPRCGGKRECVPEPVTSRREVSSRYKTRDVPEKGYLAILKIPEQFSAAVLAFLQLYTINQQYWKLEMIEPYVLGSRLAFVPPTTEDFRTLPLISKYLNRSHMLRDIQTCFQSNDVDFSTFSDFLLKAPTDFVVLQFVMTPRETQGQFYKCDFNLREIENLLNSHLKIMKNAGLTRRGRKFTGIKSLCVSATHEGSFSMKDAAENITQWMLNNHTDVFSLVVPEWRSAVSIKTKYYYYDPKISVMARRCALRTTPYTGYVMKAVQNMTENLSLGRPLIGIHVRSERVAQQEVQLQKSGFIDECVKNLTTLIQTLKKEHSVSERNIIFVHDAGAYGSKTMGKELRTASNDIISKIERLGIRNAQYIPTSSEASSMSQFVELEFLASADILVTVGFGGFQKRLIARFENYQGGLQNWYTPCDCMSKFEARQKHLL